MAHIAYYRVSTADQSIESQRKALGGPFEKEFKDEGVSGATMAKDRPGFADLLKFIRSGDTLHVYSVDRLGRDAIDVQATVRGLLEKGVQVEVHGLGRIAEGAGEIVLAVLSQVARMERQRILERTKAGRETAKEHLARTGKTHHGKDSMGRPLAADPKEVAQWRAANGASIADTAAHFELSVSTVKRYCAG